MFITQKAHEEAINRNELLQQCKGAQIPDNWREEKNSHWDKLRALCIIAIYEIYPVTPCDDSWAVLRGWTSRLS